MRGILRGSEPVVDEDRDAIMNGQCDAVMISSIVWDLSADSPSLISFLSLFRPIGVVTCARILQVPLARCAIEIDTSRR